MPKKTNTKSPLKLSPNSRKKVFGFHVSDIFIPQLLFFSRTDPQDAQRFYILDVNGDRYFYTTDTQDLMIAVQEVGIKIENPARDILRNTIGGLVSMKPSARYWANALPNSSEEKQSRKNTFKIKIEKML